ncbi:MAG: SatD family protein [Bacteroidales bacterium]|nr:SatD family protein [Bacteroidales bacterium]
MKCVITADVVNSTRINRDSREAFLDVLHRIENDLCRICAVHIEVYRGDSFQVLVEDAGNGMLCAILIRAGLMHLAPSTARWDARLSVGVGDVRYIDEQVSMSDGEAFWLSGRAFDEIGKKRLVARTNSEDINGELALTCAFADDVICGWTKKQAELMYKVLLDGIERKDLAEHCGATAQSVGKTLRAAKENLIVMFIERFGCLINKL